MSKLKNLLFSFILVGLTAYAAGFFTQVGIDSWYRLAAKPILTPPDSVFPIVWGLLYLTLIISFYLVLNKIPADFRAETSQLFISQLLLQIVWCFLFFYLGYTGLALIVLIILNIIVWQMIRIFQEISTPAGYILYPYFIWLCFAAFLNAGFIIVNGMTAS